MDRPVAYDITRLTTRVWNRTPNGIDRVDLAYGSHFLRAGGGAAGAMLFLPALGFRLLAREGAFEVIDGIAKHFGEEEDPDRDPAYANIRRWLRSPPGSGDAATARVFNKRKRFAMSMADWVLRHGPPLGRAPLGALPKGAVYLNVSQYPLGVAGAFDFAARRPDVKPVFFIHDLLPLEAPEYFKPGEYQRHERRIAAVARHGAAAIVSTPAVRHELNARLEAMGRRDLPIHVAPLPIAATFSRAEPPDAELAGFDYFMMCGTLEPRKNHLMILNMWRALVERRGAAAPRLILVGERGWENENILDLLERCSALRGHVLEVSGLSTPAFKRLLAHCRALLMPSFVEGYGLPVFEALAANTPVVAADLPAFRAIPPERCLRLSPIDGEGWLKAVVDRAAAPRAASGGLGVAPPDLAAYFEDVDAFLRKIAD